MVAKVERTLEVYTLVAILLVVKSQRLQNPKLDPRSITVLLYRTNDFDSNAGFPSLVEGLDNFAESALA